MFRVCSVHLVWLHNVDEEDIQKLLGDNVSLRQQRTHHVYHEVLHLACVLLTEITIFTV